MKSIFRDKTKVFLSAGKGGDGGVFFDNMRRPAGGFGGDGGDVYVEGDSNMSHLKEMRYGERYYADNGDTGAQNNKSGKKGESLLIKVPLITSVYNEDHELVAEIKEHGQRELILNGGRGGVGNYYFRKGGLPAKEKFTPGRDVEEMEATFEFEIDSDIIFIGYPNAGKSSLISEITNANSKIGAYAFTTIFPVLGKVHGMRLLDLPGLIEDTHQGKGLGTNFVKHTRRAKMVAHFVSFENENMMQTYETMRKELEKIDPNLAAKPEVILLTKSDMVEPAERDEMKKKFEQATEQPVYIVSTFDLEAMNNLKTWLKENLESISK